MILQDRLGGGSARRCSASATASGPRAAELMLDVRRRHRRRLAPATTERSPSCSSASSQRTPRRRSTPAGRGAMLEGVRALCARLEVPAQLALEAPMACGFGACFGCVVPARDGRYLRVCVDGPVIDAARARAASATTPGPPRERRLLRAGAGPPDRQRLRHLRRRWPPRRPSARACWRTSRSPPTSPRRSPWRPARATRRRGCGRSPAGMINSIGLPNKGLARLPRAMISPTRGYHHARARSRWRAPGRAPDHERDGLDRRASCASWWRPARHARRSRPSS